MTSIPIIWQPRYTLTSAMARGLMEIEVARAVVENTRMEEWTAKPSPP